MKAVDRAAATTDAADTTRTTDGSELAALFEGAPRFLARLAAAGPFADTEGLFDTARLIAQAMPEVEQVELLYAHPRLGAPPAAVSAMSHREQGYDRPPDSDEAQRERVAAALDRLNDAYEARFGFRYCVFVAGRSRAALLPDMAAALGADRTTELHRGLDAVVDIGRDRSIQRAAERALEGAS